MRYAGAVVPFVIFSLFLAAPDAAGQKSVSIGSLKFLGEYDIPWKKSFAGTTIGGLSGIDFDAEHNVYYLICDDRSSLQPARFYMAKIFLTSAGIDSVQIISTFPLLQKNGDVYPNSKTDPLHTPDPEAMRFNPLTHEIVWTSEGERVIKPGHQVIQHPSVTIADVTGKFKDTLRIPQQTKMSASEIGPRQNGGFEGMTFTPDFKTLFFNVEVPLLQDGPEATSTSAGSLIRIFKYDYASGKNTAQYAYLLDPVAYPAKPENGFKINGVADLLALNDHELLVLERSFSTGRLACTIKLFLTELKGADNVISDSSLSATPPVHTASKKLILNMDGLARYIDNVEGVTYGPRLPNGHATLIFVSDDNFQPFEKTQFLLFEIIP